MDCKEKDDEIEHLSTFQQGYDKLDEAFLERAAAFPAATAADRYNAYEAKEVVVATKKVATVTVHAWIMCFVLSLFYFIIFC